MVLLFAILCIPLSLQPQLTHKQKEKKRKKAIRLSGEAAGTSYQGQATSLLCSTATVN